MRPQSLGDSAAFRTSRRTKAVEATPQTSGIRYCRSFRLPIPCNGHTRKSEADCLHARWKIGLAVPGNDEDRGICASFRESRMRHISPPRRVFGPVYRAERRAGDGRHNGRDRMTRGSTKPDAMHFQACAFVIARPPVDRLLASHERASGALSLNPLAAHRAERRSPVRRVRSVGARRPGASVYGYQENAGGWHPPGRNTDRC
jgi:hypothetical protein